MTLPMPLSLGLGFSETISAVSGNTTGFGNVNFGSGSASGGAAITNAPDASGRATSSPVVPQVNTNLGDSLRGMIGGGVSPVGEGNPFASMIPGLMNAGLNTMGGLGMGLNGGQVQDPMMSALARGEAPAAAPADAPQGFPVVGIAALGLAAVAAVFIVMR